MSNNNSHPPRGAANKMLIDATHPEETRVVVLRNGRVEEFDYESAARKLLRGNIYLAKVTRVEPSLQAAFVDYGGNRHGFLAFNEIHPDYYQIPIADRRALIEAEAAAEAEDEAAADRAAEAAAARRAKRHGPAAPSLDDAEDDAIDVTPLLPPEPIEAGADAHRESEDFGRDADPRDHDEPAPREQPERIDPDPTISAAAPRSSRHDAPHEPSHDRDAPQPQSQPYDYETDPRAVSLSSSGEAAEDIDRAPGTGDVETVDSRGSAEPEQVETVATEEDALEEVPSRPRRRARSYKIQEVTKRRQVLLVQVVKEERGTKGAALTTYLSLAGRYTVLMPNTARGGGISRKINNPQDRKRLKAIAAELDVPEGMGLIIRTAGAARTKQEIKRDYEYLLRLWESVRELALNSNAPALVYEEGNLIKRSIRDLYGKEVEEVVVAGDVAFREAKDFMRMLMPSHAKNVLHYQDSEQLFSRFQIEKQLNAMFSPYVHLRSGGYLVINQTEALVAIDINSGKSTREFSIEETAYSTNMEAADEIARQLKLRDLAGLVVIDFIDMEEKRNNRAVERRIKDALRHDRARIQLGSISHFGLLEMSRQRMRTGVLEGSTTQCPHCQGTGIIRSTESVALAVLRGLEDALMAGPPASLLVTTTASVALYILNHKRAFIIELEKRYGISIQIQASEKMQGATFSIDKTARREDAQRAPERTAVNMDWGFEDEDAAEPTAGGSGGSVEMVEDDSEDDAPAAARDGEAGSNGGGGRRRKRRRRGRRDGEPGSAQGDGDRNRHGDRSRLSADGESGSADSAAAEDDDERSRDRGPGHSVSGSDPMARDDDDADGPGTEAGTEGDADGDSAAGERTEEGQAGERRGRRRRRGRRGGRRGQERGDEHGDGVRADADTDVSPSNGNEHSNNDSTTGRDDVDSDRPRMTSAASSSAARSEPQADTAQPNWSQPESSRPDWREPSTALARPHTAPAAELQPAPAQATHANEAQPVPQFERPVPVTESKIVRPDAPVPAPTPTAVSVPIVAPRREPVASEPVLARVVVGPDAAAIPQPEEAARPSRRGWWQRK